MALAFHGELNDLGGTWTFGGLHASDTRPVPPGCDKAFMIGQGERDLFGGSFGRNG